MPGVIFLDFDGPIFPSKVFIYPENNGEDSLAVCKKLNLHPYVNYWKADPNSIIMLNKLYEVYPYDLVISSSWADPWLHERDSIVAVLDINGLEYNLHKDWKTPRDINHFRHAQISDWIKLHPEYKHNYIIIDDHSSGDQLVNSQVLEEYNIIQENVFLVDVDEGMSYKQYKQIFNRILTW